MKTCREWSRLQLEIQRVVPALEHLAQPDQVNFAFLMNLDAQVHLHVVRRYALPRRWHDLDFVDPHWGSAFGDEQRVLEPDQLQPLADELRSQLA
jgi:diadenosine tetraphosphate (Ap4A) HIT family hydrolase